MTATAVAAPAHSALIEPAREAVPCYYCGETSSTDFVTAQDDLTGRPGNFYFQTCDACGLVYQNPRIDVEHIKGYYDDEYIAHRKKTNWGVLTWFYNYAMEKHDREKDSLVSDYVSLNADSEVMDVGCGAGTFLNRMRKRYGARVTGVDFKDLSYLPGFDQIEFRCGLFYEQAFAVDRFDLITMWHFLEHDYDPVRTLRHARSLLKPDGRLVIEVPRLDSLTFRLFQERWPGLQAPQHTVLYSKEMLLNFMKKVGFEIVEYLPYGAFPPYFYLFAGVAFKLLKGKGLNLSAAIYPYFLGQILMTPVLLFQRRMNLAMQTIVCRRSL
jgi:SAM-dependent methyltransferase